MRELARIEKITNIQPIKGADRIEKASVLGWQVIIKKGEFKEGELVVFFEIDSILPPHDVFEFMAPRKYRVKTIKLRKELAQGLVMPTKILKEFTNKKLKLKEGLDVTEIIGVKKHGEVKQRQRANKSTSKNPIVKFLMKFALVRWVWRNLIHRPVAGDFPTHFVSKTDEIRIQNRPSLLKLPTKCYVSEKLDGQSCTILINKDKYMVCSRNQNLIKKHKCSWWDVSDKYDIENKLKSLGKNIAIQGEIVGPGIQGNKYKREGYEFYVFNVYNIDEKIYYNIDELYQLCNDLNLKHVPILEEEVVLNEIGTIDNAVKISNRRSLLHDTLAEGIVVRSFDKKISFKVINPRFLLKNDE